ncbi:MAG: zinc-dependent metalloprotease [Actinomycetota bacterium]|nr:zinc-dependent metalloprotease [Actinomycetota bacterium]
MIDWDFAVTTGTRLVRSGPSVTRDEAREAVADLRGHAAAARRHVREHTGLVAADNGSPLAVIDRPGWVRANAEAFRTLLDPVVVKLAARRATEPSKMNVAVGSRVTALETGAILAFLAGKVLGQYELFPPPGPDGTRPQGRLLLVAPNIVAAEREMDVDRRDFRLWVCLHEETHRVQFGANPWLREHLLSEIQALLDATDVDPSAVLRRLAAAAGAIGEAVRGEPGATSLLEAVQTPEQRAILERVTAVMSLLEGHADVVMDGVGPSVIPTVDEIRARFQDRRAGAGRLEQVFRRLIGLDAKMRQYRDGARFCRSVIETVGMTGFNRVWTSPETLPTPAEIADPDAWVRRVHGSPAIAAGDAALA